MSKNCLTRYGWLLGVVAAFSVGFGIARSDDERAPKRVAKPKPATGVYHREPLTPRAPGHDIDLVFDVDVSDYPTDSIELPRRFVAGLWIPSLESDRLELSTAACDILSLNEEEIVAVNEHLANAGRQLAEIQRDHSEVTKEGEFITKVKLQAFPAKGEVLKSALEQQLDETLGVERSALFKEMAKSDLDKAFIRFGNLATTLEIEGVDLPSGRPRFQIVVEYEGKGSSSQLYESVPHWASHFIDTP